MKTTLSILALIAVAAAAVAAVAELAGFGVPSVFSVESTLGLFVSSFTLLLFGTSYARPARLREVKRVAPLLLPVAEAFVTGGSRSPLSQRRVRTSRAYYPTVTL
jgi:hypothetical protein